MSTHDSMSELKPSFMEERRAYPRDAIEIAIKLRRSANAVFSGGRTLDFSVGGALIELIGPREARCGERIAIAFENLRCPVTRAARMVGAEIIRVMPMRNGLQRVALRFDAPQMGLEGLDLPTAA